MRQKKNTYDRRYAKLPSTRHKTSSIMQPAPLMTEPHETRDHHVTQPSNESKEQEVKKTHRLNTYTSNNQRGTMHSSLMKQMGCDTDQRHLKTPFQTLGTIQFSIAISNHNKKREIN
jgi:hypothetical protein